MNLSHTSFTVGYLAAIVVSISTAGLLHLLHRRQGAKGQIALLFLMLSLAAWAAASGIHFMVVEPDLHILWIKMESFGAVNVAPLILVYTMLYTKQLPKMNPKVALILWTVPIVALGLFMTNDLHRLMWNGYNVDLVHNNIKVNYNYGFWFFALYNVFLFAVSLLLLGREFFWAQKQRRLRLGVLLTAAALPLVGIYVGWAQWNPAPGFNWYLLGCVGTGVVFSWSALHIHILDLEPIAREALIEQSHDGFLVMNPLWDIVDINQATKSILQDHGAVEIGGNAKEIFSQLYKTDIEQAIEHPIEFVIPRPVNRHIELHLSILRSAAKNHVGYLCTVRDITERKEAEYVIQETNAILQNQIAEISNLQEKLRFQAVQDVLSGVFNRRYLEETLDDQIATASANSAPVSILMLDIDHFKMVNDRYGHKAGDKAISKLGCVLLENIRSSDTACRYGGEEFTLVMPGVTRDVAIDRASQIRKALENTTVVVGDYNIRVTVSIGISVFPEDGTTGDELLDEADQALYAAKAMGRNRVEVYSPDLRFYAKLGTIDTMTVN